LAELNIKISGLYTPIGAGAVKEEGVDYYTYNSEFDIFEKWEGINLLKDR
jgi:hypothetical protein